MQKPGDIAASLLFILVGAGATVGALKLGVGTTTEPQPGFFPFIGGVVLMALSGILLFRGWSGQSSGSRGFGKVWCSAVTVLGLIVCVAIFDIAGYAIAITIVSVIVLRVLDAGKWWLIAIISLGVAIGSYLLFDRLLNVPLPSGVLTGLL